MQLYRLRILAIAATTLAQPFSFLHAAEWTWTGFFSFNYEDDTRPGRSGSFDAYDLSIGANVSLTERLRLVTQIDYEHAAYIDFVVNPDGTKDLDKRTSGEITVSNAYAQYTFSKLLSIKGGKFFAPIGFYNQITYAVPTFPTLKIPQESVYKRRGTPQEDSLFFQRYVTGAWVSGEADLGPGSLSYDAYLSNGRSFRQHVDDNDSKAVGGRLKYAVDKGQVELCPLLSFYIDEYNSGSPASPIWTKQRTVLPGIEIVWKDLTVRAELGRSRLSSMDGAAVRTSSAYYGEAHYTMRERFTPFVRHESYDPDSGSGRDRESETVVGLAYHIEPWVAQVKMQVGRRDFESPDKDSYTLFGIGVALGF
ncbi:MAG: hypothetical protein HYX75_02250 [Acidobacteria bacterium]|nr:hypothetical protein [Acidobacteriota bacterium]